MDKDVRAVFIGAIVSMFLSAVALNNHPNKCKIEVTKGQVTHVLIGTYDE